MIRNLERGRSLAGVFASLVVLLGVGGFVVRGSGEKTSGTRPDVLIVTVDTLRADRLSFYGYGRPTSPQLDRLFSGAATFTNARTVEPLTSPSLCSMVTSADPHRHGSSRNGLRMRPGLPSFPKELRKLGYRTAAFVGNWTLRDKLSGLAEHFDSYEEVLTKARWFGIARSEATAEDVNEAAVAWLRAERAHGSRPVMVWVHYTEPHAPYQLWSEEAERLGLDTKGDVPPQDRYDTEVAYVDREIGELLGTLEAEGLLRDPLIVFASDHGESLGEHDYWGHGRNLYEPTLRIPLAVSWAGRVPSARIAEPALITDIGPTVLGLVGGSPSWEADGQDWTAVLRGTSPAPAGRITRHQAHRGAVMSRHESDLLRRAGLLEVGLIHGTRKETYRVGEGQHRLFDLVRDPGETRSLTRPKDLPSEALDGWMREIYARLGEFDEAPPSPLDEESAARLKSLGYVD